MESYFFLLITEISNQETSAVHCGKVFTSKFVGTGPSSYKKRIYRAVVSQRLRNTDVGDVSEERSGCV